MKQILQDLGNGKTSIEDVPCPTIKDGYVLIQSSKSLISSGTERMLIEFGKANLIDKALSQPEKVKMVMEKLSTDGLTATFDAVKSKLDQPIPLGYSNVGKVIQTLDSEFKEGDRVISNGYHAEVIRTPKNLTCKIPDGVDDETASFTVVGSIALQGIRLISPNIGETVVVYGLGLIGLLAVQILIANGCKVIGIDFDKSKCDVAERFGAKCLNPQESSNIVNECKKLNGHEVDSVLITASSKSNEIIDNSAKITRKRGKIVLIGVVGLEIDRSLFYEKELSFQVSCSYGPGRYDSTYEEDGIDYPFAFVRWTEKRNFEAILTLMNKGLINTKSLISSTYKIEEANKAYDHLESKSPLALIIDYGIKEKKQDIVSQSINISDSKIVSGVPNISFVGAGNYASRVLIPAFKKQKLNFINLITSGGINSQHFGKKFGFKTASTNFEKSLSEDTDIVVIATQHDLHAKQTIQALNADKHVFVEKPLAMNYEELENIDKAAKNSKGTLMVGYNRRFSPLVTKLKSRLDLDDAPKTFIFTMNAGHIPNESWVHDQKKGGGRIIGEACHYIDLMRFLAGSKIKSIDAIKISQDSKIEKTEDKSIITLCFEDGSIGSIHYFANGSKSFQKERIEVFTEGKIMQINNFLNLKAFGYGSFKGKNLFSQNKGNNECVSSFIRSVNSNAPSPIDHDELIEVAKFTIEAAEKLRT